MGMRNERIKELEEENQIQANRIAALKDEIRIYKQTIGKLHSIIDKQENRLRELDGKIRVGDEVEHELHAGKYVTFIVTDIADDGQLYGIEVNGGTHDHTPDGWKKTGRHFDIIGILKKLTE